MGRAVAEGGGSGSRVPENRARPGSRSPAQGSLGSAARTRGRVLGSTAGAGGCWSPRARSSVGSGGGHRTPRGLPAGAGAAESHSPHAAAGAGAGDPERHEGAGQGQAAGTGAVCPERAADPASLPCSALACSCPSPSSSSQGQGQRCPGAAALPGRAFSFSLSGANPQHPHSTRGSKAAG